MYVDVLLTSLMSFYPHINKIVAKASKMLDEIFLSVLNPLLTLAWFTKF